jgi:hypothetical protein
MDDSKIHGSIERLVAEEHQLWDRESDGIASEDDRRRLAEIRVSLDQCWDLLRQRRARTRPGHRRGSAARRRRGLRAVRPFGPTRSPPYVSAAACFRPLFVSIALVCV